MTAASSICRIRLTLSTAVSTSNWKALAIAVLLRLGRSPDQSPLQFYRVSTDWQQASGFDGRRVHRDRKRPVGVGAGPGKWRARERQVVPGFRAENSNTSRHLAEFWMIEPEIADLSDNAALAEALLKYACAALLIERQEDLAFFDQRIEEGAGRETRGDRRLGIRAYGLRRGDPSARAGQRGLGVPGQLGHRPAVGARALSDREIREEAGHRDELPEGHPRLLHADERRRPDGRSDGRAGPGDRRDHRRQPARGAARSAGCTHGRVPHRPEALRPTLPFPAGGTRERGRVREGICGATARCRTPSRSRERRATRGIDWYSRPIHGRESVKRIPPTGRGGSDGGRTGGRRLALPPYGG